MLTDYNIVHLLEQYEQQFHNSVDKSPAPETIRSWATYVKEKLQYAVISRYKEMELVMIYYIHFAESKEILPNAATMLKKFKLSGIRYFEMVKTLKAGGFFGNEFIEEKTRRDLSQILLNLELPPALLELGLRIFAFLGSRVQACYNSRLVLTAYVLTRLQNTPTKYILIAKACNVAVSTVSINVNRHRDFLQRGLRLFRPPTPPTAGIGVRSS
jgi:hypothetical protein